MYIFIYFMTEMLLSIILSSHFLFIYNLSRCPKCVQNTNQEECESSTFISNATRMTFLWRGYASNWQSAKVRAIVLIVIPPSVITQRHDRITLAVICAAYRLSGLWTQTQFNVSFVLSKSERNCSTRGFIFNSFSNIQFVRKANVDWERHRKSVGSCDLVC